MKSEPVSFIHRDYGVFHNAVVKPNPQPDNVRSEQSGHPNTRLIAGWLRFFTFTQCMDRPA